MMKNPVQSRSVSFLGNGTVTAVNGRRSFLKQPSRFQDLRCCNWYQYARAATTAMSKRKIAPRAAMGGGRRRAPTVLSRIGQSGPERPREPHAIEDSQAVKHGRYQNPHATAVVEGCEGVGRCASLFAGLRAA